MVVVGRKLCAEERQGEHLGAAPGLFEEGVRRRLFAALALDPRGPPVVHDGDLRRARIERQLQRADARVVVESGGHPHPQHSPVLVYEGDGGLRVAEPRRDGVEHERQLLVELLRGEQLRRHLEQEFVLVDRHGARRALFEGVVRRGRGLGETVIHKIVGSKR